MKSETSVLEQRALQRRDYFLLPVVSLVTIVMMLGAAEVIARAGWPEMTFNKCIQEDPLLHVFHATPNCDATTKIAEGPWVSYHFNECGYRTFASCGAKPATTIRLAVMGSSIPEGLHVPFESSFAERTSRAIAQATGRPVQLENLGLATLMPLWTYRKVNEAINLHPDVVIYAVAPLDVAEPMNRETLEAIDNGTPIKVNPSSNKGNTILKKVQNLLNNSRAFMVGQHFLFSNTEMVLNLFLGYGERAAYLRSPISPKWAAHYTDFELILSEMATRFHRAGIPMILVAVPSREEAALLSVAHRPPHTDPYDFTRRLQAMASRLNIGYVDAVQEFAKQPHSDRLFYNVDLHIDSRGHALVANALVRKCLDGSIPSLASKAIASRAGTNHGGI